MRKLLPILLLLLLMPIAIFARQGENPPRLEITGVDASQLPTAIITANLVDNLGQPVSGLTIADFALSGSLSQFGGIVDVQNIADDNLPFATVLVVDVSSSMTGVPLENAKAAARIYIEALRPEDVVALIAFSSSVNVVLPYTTDKNALISAVDSLQAAGETALYQAGYEAVRLAAESPVARRVVIFLSDGGEFGGNSAVNRDAGSLEALTRGVPVYTIGLGFGIDRSYLQQFSSATNARFYESPNGDELQQIYLELAQLLRSQYVITLQSAVPQDGVAYDFTLRATTAQGSAEAAATLRAPIPMPIVRLTGVPEGAIITPVTLTADILADDPITSVTFTVGDQPSTTITEAPYAISIDPTLFAPGDLPLTINATDDDNEVGGFTSTLTIGVLPPVITFDPDPATLGAISTPTTINILTSGQTVVTSITSALDGAEAITLAEPYSITIDPILFSPGEHVAFVTATNAGGETSFAPLIFQVAPVPPSVSIRGLQDGQTLDAVTTFTANVITQGQLTALTASVGETTIPADSAGLLTVDPISFAPGANTLTVTATSDNGLSGSATLTLIVPALQPQILLSGLTAGDLLSEDRAISIDFISQTPIANTTLALDALPFLESSDVPLLTTLGVLSIAPGDHILTITTVNDSGQTATLEMPFSIAPEPAATATAIVAATTTAIFQEQATATAIVIEATASQEALFQAGTATQGAIIEATATQAAIIEATATQAAIIEATATQGAIINATATQAAIIEATATQAAIVEATNAQAAIIEATATQAAIIEATAAQAAIIEATNAQAALIEATATQAAIIEATATQAAIVEATNAQEALYQTATQIVNDATATQDALVAGTATALASIAETATQAALVASTATQGAIIDATTTQAAVEAAATQDAATATQDALIAATATQDALIQTATQIVSDATATQVVVEQNNASTAIAATQQQQRLSVLATVQIATRDALATSRAQSMEILAATQDTRQTRNAQATLAVERTATAQALNAAATQTAVQQATADAVNAAAAQTATQIIVEATGTAQALITQTAVQQATADAVNASIFQTATQVIVEATGTAQAAFTQAAIERAATEAAAATATIQQLSIEATASAIANATVRANILATDDGATQIAATDQLLTRSAVTREAAQSATGVVETRDTESTRSAQQTAVAPLPTTNIDAQAAQQTDAAATPTIQPTLTPIQAEDPATSGDLAPLLLVGIAAILIIILLFFALRRRS